MDLTRDRWVNSTRQEREALAQHLATQLPLGFAYRGMKHFVIGKQENEVALYADPEGTLFSFIPSGSFVIGFDGADTWQPNPDEQESWQETAEEWEWDQTIQEQVHEVTQRTREVDIEPLLVETVASEIGWESADLNHPLVRKTIKEMEKPVHQSEVLGGDIHLRVTRNVDGTFTALQALPLVHSDLLANFQQVGFRFPTSEEWEYVCGGGARTLFRWGDHVPCDHYPTDKKGLNDEPNALGLYIATDPYKYEIVMEEGVVRGGDGGSAICGGTGFFCGWLPLATAYFAEYTCLYEPDDLDELMGYLVGRRVLPLS